MVSTRGSTTKFKFSEGERVLCFEPDPTKARVLYDAKVLEIREGKDNRGRRSVEYLIHFQGWNSSWDRYVAESYVLKCNEENRALQKELAEAARSLLKEKSKRKRSRAAPKSLSESEASNDDGESVTRSSFGEDSAECDDGQSDSDEVSAAKETLVVNLPSSLKSFMEEDCRNITQRRKLHQLPVDPCIVSLLEGFVRNFAYNLVCKSPEKNRSHRNSTSSNTSQGTTDGSSSQGTLLSLCKEVADGLRVSFDFMLPLTLLYPKERDQYQRISNSLTEATQQEETPFKGSNTNVGQHESSSVDNPLINDAMQWKILPQDCEGKFLPCKVYGAAHLLRLMVKLPDILPKMALTEVKRTVVMNHVDLLLQYLATQNVLSNCVYINSSERR